MASQGAAWRQKRESALRAIPFFIATRRDAIS